MIRVINKNSITISKEEFKRKDGKVKIVNFCGTIKKDLSL